jgi:uncharacterized protein (TIGR02145 family)
MKITTLLFISFVCISIFGQVQTVTIGTQVWMTKNLDVSTFRNGEIIPEAKTNIEWEAAGDNKQPAWCYYDNNPANGTKYGKLYNWYAVNDPRGLAPDGWHVPTDQEWYELAESIDPETNGLYAGSKMKMPPVFGPTKIEYYERAAYFSQDWVICSNCKNWNSEYRKKVPCHVCKDERGRYVQGKYHPKTKEKYEKKGEQIDGWNGDNSSGFSGLQSGSRDGYGNFGGVGVGGEGHWWSATLHKAYNGADINNVFTRILAETNGLIREPNSKKCYGLSVRCVNDNASGGKNGSGNGSFGTGNSNGGDGGLGKGDGIARLRISNVSLPQYEIDYDVTIHLQLTINENGEVVAAKCIKSKTTCTDQRIINQVINEVMKQVKYKKEIGAGLVYNFYTVKILAK